MILPVNDDNVCVLIMTFMLPEFLDEPSQAFYCVAPCHYDMSAGRYNNQCFIWQ